MIIPRTDQPKIMTLRSCDYSANNGVLPLKCVSPKSVWA